MSAICVNKYLCVNISNRSTLRGDIYSLLIYLYMFTAYLKLRVVHFMYFILYGSCQNA